MLAGNTLKCFAASRPVQSKVSTQMIALDAAAHSTEEEQPNHSSESDQ
jgi:hypothetical protein